MIKKITFLLLLALSIISVSAANTYVIKGVTYEVDTLFHAQVGPGTTQTSLLFKGPTYNLRAFYLTIDLMNPQITIRTVCANDKVAGNQLTSEMAQGHSAPGKQYFAGVNGDFFATTGTSTNGKSIVGTPTAACIVDGEFYKTSFGSSGNKQFAIDEMGLPFVGLVNFRTGTVEKGTDKVLFKGVNESSQDNGITVYTHRYYGSTNQTARANACAEVTAKLVDGEVLMPGKSCKMEITSTATATGDLAIPDNGYVLHGRGTVTTGGTMGALAFVQGLKVGDIVTINAKVLLNDEEIVPTQMISGNPRTVGDGKTLDTEHERGDATGYHPRTGIGYGSNKTKVIMMVVDGRSNISNGATTSQVGEIIRYAGGTDAINLDGGGSSTLYTQALGIRNRPSDGKERADGNAIFVVSHAPEDTQIAELRFVDWAMQFPKYGTYVPKFYGYNKYGVLVNTDVQGVTLSCPKELGYIENGSKFVGIGSGTHALSASCNGLTASIPVSIVETDDISMRHTQLIHDGYRNYAVEVEATMHEQKMPLSSSALTWSTDDASICEVDPQTGIIKGITNGETVVRGTVGAFAGETKIIVEKPTARVMPVDPNLDINTWSISQTGGTGMVATPVGDGMKLTYTGNAVSRGAKIQLTKKFQLWSLPDTFRIRINPGSAPITKVTVSARANEGGVSYVTLDAPKANEMNVIDMPTASWCDADDVMNYPIHINYIQFDMAASAKGTEYTIEIPGIETVYKAVDPVGGVDNVVKNDRMQIYPNPVKEGTNAILKTDFEEIATISIVNIAGQQVKSFNADANTTIELPTSDLSAGAYVVTVSAEGSIVNTKLIIR